MILFVLFLAEGLLLDGEDLSAKELFLTSVYYSAGFPWELRFFVLEINQCEGSGGFRVWFLYHGKHTKKGEQNN